MKAIHQRIRDDIEGRILSGEWPPGHRVPFEHELMAEYGCSRMTVSKALSALAATGLILRRRRAGSVVAAPSTERAVLQSRISPSTRSAPARPTGIEIVQRAIERLEAKHAQRLSVPAGTEVLALATLHVTDGVPAAYETRLVNLAVVPEARDESFAALPPGTWLLRKVPWTEAEHVISAVNADRALARNLAVAAGAACLVLERRTWQAGAFVTEARIAYPGDRHRLVGRFSPVAQGG